MDPVGWDDFVRGQLSDCESHWSMGSFGALAEFCRDAEEVTEVGDSGLSVVTSRGGIRVPSVPDVQLMASEGLTSDSWTQRIAL